MSLIESVSREARFLSSMLRTVRRVAWLRPDGSETAADLIEKWAARTPEAVAIRFEDRLVTYADYDAQGNRYARWAQERGLGQGDVVALLMENRPEYLFAWLGLAKLGITSALINTNLRGQPLAHSLRLSRARRLILGDELSEAYGAVRDQLEDPPELWTTSDGREPGGNLDLALEKLDATPLPPATRAGLTSRDKLFYIYTSGTTGSPKAANVSHFRFLSVAHGFSASASTTAKDRMYVVLPLYHSAGGVCAIGCAFSVGASIVLRRRFSASQFWEDCTRYEVTLFQYIGELCRYLLNSPEHPDERRHAIRMCLGNGLRPEVWGPFQERFAIPRIFEFYGATEGNVALLNPDGKVGAVGRVPGYLARFMNIKLIRFDVANETHVRGTDGFCIECGPDEVGELIGLIPRNSKSGLGAFEGYTSEQDTEKKILRNVFGQDDAWFRTGDLLKRDRESYYYFIDRIGDTFRWKGENVATSEVAEVISLAPGVSEANVYGVRVGQNDGRAGMAALVVGKEFDLDALYHRLVQELAAYARPLFLRLQPEIEITGTFKHRKVDLVEQGFDPDHIAEPLYFAHPEKGCFVPLDRELHASIAAGAVRL